MLFAWLTFAGLVLTTLASTANRCLYDVAWHELEDLCQQRKKEATFGKILDLREQLEFGVGIDCENRCRTIPLLHMALVVALFGCLMATTGRRKVCWSDFPTSQRNRRR